MLSMVQYYVLILAFCIHVITAVPSVPFPVPGFKLAQPLSTHLPGGEEHIVIVSSTAPHVPDVLKRINLEPGHNDVRYVYNNSAFRGFSARLHSHHIDTLNQMIDVLHVEKPALTTSLAGVEATEQQHATWGLQRISSTTPPFGNPKALSYTYSYESNSTLGRDVDIYVVDTGINTENVIFGGRATMGFSFNGNMKDNDGHGTHVSGTSGGLVVGVASGANIIGVKVLGANGAGSTSDVLAGMDFVIKAHDSRKAAASSGSDESFAGSVMNMSWGLSSISRAIQTAIRAALDHGIHISMAAGNSASNACGVSPSAAGGSRSAAVSVGSISPTSIISSFSNTGPCVDLYAPGEDVLSAWIGGTNVLNYLSGTSMATPHVTGVMAYLLSGDTTGLLRENPAALKQKLLNLTRAGVVQGNDDTIDGNPKLLLNNGMVGRIGNGITLYGTRRSPNRLKRSFSRSAHRKNAGSTGKGATKSLQLGKTSLTGEYEGVPKLRY